MRTNPYDEAEPVVLTEDASAVARRELQQLSSGIRYLHDMLLPGMPVNRDFIYNVLYVAEARLTQMGQITGVETDGANAIADRMKALQTANARIRELEAELGKGASPAHAEQSIKYLCEKLAAWWRKDGLGFMRDATFNQYGNLRVTFSCTLFGSNNSMLSETPVTDKERHSQWLNSLELLGFELMDGHTARGHHLTLSDKNRVALMAMIQRSLPSATLHSINSHHSKNGLRIQDITVYIENLNDVLALPDPVN